MPRRAPLWQARIQISARSSQTLEMVRRDQAIFTLNMGRFHLDCIHGATASGSRDDAFQLDSFPGLDAAPLYFRTEISKNARRCARGRPDVRDCNA